MILVRPRLYKPARANLSVQKMAAIKRQSPSVSKPVLMTLTLVSVLTLPKGWADNYFNPAFLSDDPSGSPIFHVLKATARRLAFIGSTSI